MNRWSTCAVVAQLHVEVVGVLLQADDRNVDNEMSGVEESDLLQAIMLSMETAENHNRGISDVEDQEHNDVVSSYDENAFDCGASEIDSEVHSIWLKSASTSRTKNAKNQTQTEPDEKEIELVMTQAECNRSDALNALKLTGNDIVEAIFHLQTSAEVIFHINDQIVSILFLLGDVSSIFICFQSLFIRLMLRIRSKALKVMTSQMLRRLLRCLWSQSTTSLPDQMPLRSRRTS